MKIAVYCGSGLGNSSIWAETAEKLGTWIGENGHTLIYGGGDSGLMGIVAKAAYAHGIKVIGVLPGNVPFICNRPQPYCTETITTSDMAARKQQMLTLADAFIALPGGIGTLDEITEVITLTKIGVFNKPSVLFNTNGFYEPFRALLTQMEQAAFIEAGSLPHVLFSDTLSEISDFFAQYR